MTDAVVNVPMGAMVSSDADGCMLSLSMELNFAPCGLLSPRLVDGGPKVTSVSSQLLDRNKSPIVLCTQTKKMFIFDAHALTITRVISYSFFFFPENKVFFFISLLCQNVFFSHFLVLSKASFLRILQLIKEKREKGLEK